MVELSIYVILEYRVIAWYKLFMRIDYTWLMLPGLPTVNTMSARVFWKQKWCL